MTIALAAALALNMVGIYSYLNLCRSMSWVMRLVMRTDAGGSAASQPHL